MNSHAHELPGLHELLGHALLGARPRLTLVGILVYQALCRPSIGDLQAGLLAGLGVLDSSDRHVCGTDIKEGDQDEAMLLPLRVQCPYVAVHLHDACC